MRKLIRAFLISAAMAVAVISAPGIAMASAAPTGHAVAVQPAYVSRITAAYEWAVKNTAGHRYCYGGNGTSANGFGCPAGTYDCSGEVAAAYAHAGIALPHNTVAMLTSGKLHRVATPKAGDLAFFRTGHVELYAYGHTTFGAHSSHDPVIGFRAWSASWHPTAFYRI
jgi:peptidoglycan DL-endopeptidase CwlO